MDDSHPGTTVGDGFKAAEFLLGVPVGLLQGWVIVGVTTDDEILSIGNAANDEMTAAVLADAAARIMRRIATSLHVESPT